MGGGKPGGGSGRLGRVGEGSGGGKKGGGRRLLSTIQKYVSCATMFMFKL